MWIVIAGFDYSQNMDISSIQLDQAINDPVAKAGFTVKDPGSHFSFNIGDEVIIWDEYTPPQGTPNPAIVALATPGHNILLPQPSGWSPSGALSGLITNTLFPVMTFNNTTYSGGNNYGLLSCTTPFGYIHAGQQYMLSVYATISTPLVNCQATIQMQFLDEVGNVLSTTFTNFTTTTNNALQQLSISATAPTGAYLAIGSLGGYALVSGSNSGTINFGAAQMEPMWFTAEGVSYPTPDLNQAQADCALMPDNTISRISRLFSGFIQNTIVTYDGPNRQWQIQCVGPGILLESGLMNATFTGQYDTQIITTLVNTYFPGQISINAQNTVSPSPLVQGIVIDSVSYNDNTLREALNGLTDASGYMYFLDMYYRLNYVPSFYNAANFQLIDGIPDNSSTFNFHDYSLEDDGTQLKRRIKVNGGNFTGSFQDVFSGNGSTTQFTLTYIPDKAPTITVGGTSQRVGVYGRDKFSSGKYDVLLNKQNSYILFNSAPATGTNNVVVTYNYHAPISVQTTMQTSTANTPAYVFPLFDAKVNDTNLVSLNTATSRGLAEILKYGSPLQILKFKSFKFAPAGYAIYLTSNLDKLVNAPFVIQTMTGRYLGGGINVYEYQAGAYQPSLIDHIRNANKALNRSTTVSNANAIQQIDVVATEQSTYFDALVATAQATYPAGVYGTAHYGGNSYGGSAGHYGDAASTYGQSTLYS